MCKSGKKDRILSLNNRIAELENEKKLFVEASYDGFWDWRIQEDYEYMSPRFWEMFGLDYRMKAHHPSEWMEMIHPDDLKVAEENFNKHCESSGKHRYIQEVRYKHSNGNWCTVLCRGQVVAWDRHGKAVRMIGTHTDITNLKRIQEELERSNSALEAFAHSVSHDLQEPIRTISGFANHLLENLGPFLNEDYREDLQYILSASRRLKTLVESLLDYSKVGRSGRNFQTISVPKVLDEIREDFAPTIKKIQGELRVKSIPSIRGIKSEIKRLFSNLVSNSIKYRGEQNLIVSVWGKKKNTLYLYIFMIME